MSKLHGCILCYFRSTTGGCFRKTCVCKLIAVTTDYMTLKNYISFYQLSDFFCSSWKFSLELYKKISIECPVARQEPNPNPNWLEKNKQTKKPLYCTYLLLPIIQSNYTQIIH